jgi:DNA-binding MarR family transcriptional regulator
MEPRRLPILLRRAWFSLNQTFRRRIAHTGLTPDQYIVMRNLWEHSPTGLTQNALTRLMVSDPNTVAALLERMERSGWIARQRHETDRRAKRICLLPSGERKFKQVRKIALALQTEILSGLNEQQRDDFLHHLAIVADACHAAASK